jgi:hypothetical protein
MLPYKRLGECLIKAKILSAAQLDSALQKQQQTGGLLGQILLERKLVSEKQLCQALSEAFQVQWVTIEHILITDDTIALVPESLAASCRILPLFFHKTLLYLVMENPHDTGAIQLVEFTTGMKVKPLVAPQDQLNAMLQTYYHLPPSMLDNYKPATAQETSPTASSTLSGLTDQIKLLAESHRKRLGEILVEAALIRPDQLRDALRLQNEHGGWIGSILVEQGWVTDEEICRVLSESLHIRYVQDDQVQIAPEAMQFVPESLAASCNVFPMFIEKNVLYLAMENPLDSGVIQLVEYCTGKPVMPMIASPDQIQRMLRRYYPGIQFREKKQHR